MLSDYKYLETLPEANPIRIQIASGVNEYQMNTLYKFKDIGSLNNYSSQKEKLQIQTKFEKETILYTDLEEAFKQNKYIYDKYLELQYTPMTRTLKLNGEFNQVLCNLNKLSNAKKLNEQQSSLQLIKPSLELGDELVFDSDFESGNLSKVVKNEENSYLLFLQNDINTKGHTQWFYFRVRNGKLLGKYRFQIINLSKIGYLYDNGMKICVYSREEEKKSNKGWLRDGIDISYKKTGMVKTQIDELNREYWYCLSFYYDFTHQDDEVFFSQSQPYTLTDLNFFLSKQIQNYQKSKYMSRTCLCKTLIGNRVEKLTISSSENPETPKKGIVIMGRVHPGETVSSFIIQGIIEWLISNDPLAKQLREFFIIKIIPMLNPDGVIHGNQRCSLAGCDLNRRWRNPIKELHPEIYYAKQMILQFNKLTKVVLAIDCHGHNLKKSIFMYGCQNLKSQQFVLNQQDDLKQRLQGLACKQFPYLLSKIDENFLFKNCSFQVQKDKITTARVSLWNELRIPQVYTLEASFCGPEHSQTHFTVQDLQNLGMNVCRAVQAYFFDQETGAMVRQHDFDIRKKKVQSKPDVQKKQKQLIDYSPFESKETSLLDLKQNYDQEIENNDDRSSNGSDDQPSLDNLSVEMLKNVIPKKARKKMENESQHVIKSLEKKQIFIEPTILTERKETQIKINRIRKKKILRNISPQSFYPQQQKSPQKQYVEVPIKVFDASWFLPSCYVNEQQQRQRKLINQIFDVNYRREIEELAFKQYSLLQKDSFEKIERQYKRSIKESLYDVKEFESARTNQKRNSSSHDYQGSEKTTSYISPIHNGRTQQYLESYTIKLPNLNKSDVMKVSNIIVNHQKKNSQSP